MRRFFLLALFVMCVLHAEVRTNTSLKEYFDTIELREGDLVVFDIDGTLVATQEPAIDGALVKKHWGTLGQLTEWTPLKKEIVFSFTCRFPMMLIEEKTPKLLVDIKQRGIPMVAITACQTAPCGDEETPIIRFKQLDELGMTLSNPLNEEGVVSFTELERVLGYYPTYYRGVITSNPWYFGSEKMNEKGDALRSLIERMPQRPKRVIFCDDQSKHHSSIEAVLKEMEIEFEGCLYLGGENLQQQPVPIEQFKEVWKGIIDKADRLIETTPSLSEETLY